MKKVLSGIAISTLVLGTTTVALAQPKSTVHYQHQTIKVGNYQASVQGFAALDGHTQTTYMPVWYIMQGFTQMGYTAT